MRQLRGQAVVAGVAGYPLPGTRLLALDLPGFGESPGGHAFAPCIPSYARARFLDTLSINRAILAGHSLRAAVATQLALSDPGRFPGMFLLSPAPPPVSTLPSISTPSWRATATTASVSARPYSKPCIRGYPRISKTS